MKTLIELYQSRKKELKNQLIEAGSLSQYVDRIQDEINRFRDSKSEYIGNLTPSQANVALKGLEEINQSIILLKAVENAQFYSSELLRSKGKSESSASKSTNYGMISVAIAIVAVVATVAVLASGSVGNRASNFVGGLLTTKKPTPSQVSVSLEKLDILCKQKYAKPPEPPKSPKPPEPNNNSNLKKFPYPDITEKIYAVCTPQGLTNDAITPTNSVIIKFWVVGMFAVIVVGIFLLLKRKQHLEKSKPVTQLTQTHRTELEETINAILSYFQKKLEAIDNEVAKEGNKTPSKPSSPKIEDHPELLEILQNLIGLEADRNEQVHLPKLTRNIIKQIRQFLKLNNIEVIFYQPGMDNLSKFDFVSSSNAQLKKHITLIPAFVKNNHVILRGRVVKSSSV